MSTYQLPAGHVLVMRTCDANGKAKNGGFQWPDSGEVECEDWSPDPVCGRGLHGLLWGAGNIGLLSWAPDAKWYAVEVAADSIVELDGKVKFPRGRVVLCGDAKAVAEFISAHAPTGTQVVMGTATAGDWGTATAGDMGTATAGNNGTAIAGDMGTAFVGDRGAAKAGVGGLIAIQWWDSHAQRHRLAAGCVGEDGLEPNTFYRVEGGKFVKAAQEPSQQ